MFASEPVLARKPHLWSEPIPRRKPLIRSEPSEVRKPMVMSEPTHQRKPTGGSELKEKGEIKPIGKSEEADPLVAFVDAGLTLEKLRVQEQVRRTHLEKQGRVDKYTDELLKRTKDLEDYVDDTVAVLVKQHPAYPWFSRIKGCGRENVAKVVGNIDVTKAPTASSVVKWCGYAPGHDKKVKGQQLEYNAQVRALCWRLATSLKRAKGKFYYYYKDEKEKYIKRFLDQGYKILPTPTGKWACLNCGKSWAKKGDVDTCCENQVIATKLREEPKGVIWAGHLDAMAVRKMIKRFLVLLWAYWREAEGLPTRVPYPQEYLGHDHMVVPGDMCDR